MDSVCDGRIYVPMQPQKSDHHTAGISPSVSCHDGVCLTAWTAVHSANGLVHALHHIRWWKRWDQAQTSSVWGNSNTAYVCLWHGVDSVVSHRSSSWRRPDVIRFVLVYRMGGCCSLFTRGLGFNVLFRIRQSDLPAWKAFLLLQTVRHGWFCSSHKQPRQKCTCLNLRRGLELTLNEIGQHVSLLSLGERERVQLVCIDCNRGAIHKIYSKKYDWFLLSCIMYFWDQFAICDHVGHSCMVNSNISSGFFFFM